MAGPAEVDLSADLLPRHAGVLRALQLLSRGVDTDRWCLVGGLMVLVAARAVGGRLPRPEQTKDGDIVVDVCAEPGALGRVAAELRKYGYEIPPEASDDERLTRCTFMSPNVQLDVLAPDDAPAAELVTADGLRSLAIPGGRRALELSEPVRIYYAEDQHDAVVRVPLWPGAIVVKASAALDERTAPQFRHIQDVAALLTLAADPEELRSATSEADLALIGQLAERLSDAGDVAWEGMTVPDRLRGQAAARLLLRR